MDIDKSGESKESQIEVMQDEIRQLQYDVKQILQSLNNLNRAVQLLADRVDDCENSK